jgi:hypothetical protein
MTQGEFMHSRTLATVVTVATIAALFLSLAAASDVNLGVWKLNEAKSQLIDGQPKATRIAYEVSGDSVKVITDGEDGAGKPTHNEWTGRYDGQDYPVTGDPGADTRALKQLDAHTVQFVAKKAGHDVATGIIVVSSDGKTSTVNMTQKLAPNIQGHSYAVYDREEGQ